MKQCPACNAENENDAIRCVQCDHEFEPPSEPPVPKDESSDDDDEGWPSDEWKDWNTM